MAFVPRQGGFSAPNGQPVSPFGPSLPVNAADVYIQVVPVSLSPSQQLEDHTAGQTFEDLTRQAIVANAQVNNQAVQNQGTAIMGVIHRGFSHMNHHIEEVGAHINELNSSMLNVNEYAMKQAVDIDGARNGYNEAREVILKQNATIDRQSVKIEALERKVEALEKMVRDLAKRQAGA